MASIDKRADGHYRARWREYPGGPQKTRQFARKGDAQRFIDAIRGDLARCVYIDPAGGRTLFRDYAEQWRAGQVHRPSTAAQLETYLRLHAYPTLGRRPLGAVRRSEVQAWVKGRTARPGTRVGRAGLPLGGHDLQGGSRGPPHRLVALRAHRPAQAGRRRGGAPQRE